MPTPPYTPAHLVNDTKPVTDRWYIVFWAWNALENKKIRKRCYKVNLLKTRTERLTYAKKMIAAINALLEGGYHFNPKKAKQENVALYADRARDYTINEAFKYISPIIKNSKRIDTYNSYQSLSNLFLAFCEDAGWSDWKIKSVEQVDIISFLYYMQTTREGKPGKQYHPK